MASQKLVVEAEVFCMTAPDVKCFHIAIVVRDLDAAVEGYRRLLGAEHWRVRAMSAGTRIAYGSGSGATWELIEVSGAGTSQFHEFRDQHGEGVQHIGFWTPDLRASVLGALEGGAELVSATTDAQGNSAVQLLPAEAVEGEQLDKLGIGAFLEAGFGGWRIEYIGPSGEAFLKDWLQEEYPDICITPMPW
jgi:catechol 2,3-dioxygenase-like lactoylglutathione lyase family enzyme